MTPTGQNSNHLSGGGSTPLTSPAGRVLRWVWTLVSFTLFGLGALGFGLVYFPLLCLLVWNRARRQTIARRTVSLAFGAFIRFMGVFGLSWESHGIPRTDEPGGVVVVANHPTLIDAVFLMWLLPGADCVVKASHWRNPLMMFAVRAAGYLPNNDEERLLTEGIRRTREGRCLLLFPQGTRSRPGEEPQFRRGAAVIANRAEVPVLPVRISCAPPLLRKGDSWLSVTERRPHFVFQALPEMHPETWTRNNVSERKGTWEMTGALSVLLLDEVN